MDDVLSSDPNAPACPGGAQPPCTGETLWDLLRRHGDIDARAALIEAYRPFARSLAATLYGRRVDDDIGFDDYHQWSLLGMIESIDRFDPAQGAKFETFASRRMHGRVIDGIESATEKQRQIAARRRLRASRLVDVRTMAGADVSTLRDDDLLGYLSEVGMGIAVSMMLEGTGMIDATASADAMLDTGYERAELRLLRDSLQASIAQLSNQEQSVIRSHYLDDHPFEDIAAKLQLTKGRISQLHRQALGKLRQILGAGRQRDFLA